MVIILCSVVNGDYIVQSSSMVISPIWTENSHVVFVSLLRAFIVFQLAVSGSSVNGNLTESTCKSHTFSKRNWTTSEWPIWYAKWMGNIPWTQLFLTYILVYRVYLLFWNRSRIKSTFPISAKEWRGLWPVWVFLMFTSAPYSAAIQWCLSFRAELHKTTPCFRQRRECWVKFRGSVRLECCRLPSSSAWCKKRVGPSPKMFFRWALVRRWCDFYDNLSSEIMKGVTYKIMRK